MIPFAFRQLEGLVAAGAGVNGLGVDAGEDRAGAQRG